MSQAFPETLSDAEKKSLWHICQIHMHFEKLADPNPRFRLFGAPESRFPSVLGQGKGALWIPKPWVRCFLIRAPKNGSMAVQLLRVRARSAPIQGCTQAR